MGLEIIRTVSCYLNENQNRTLKKQWSGELVDARFDKYSNVGSFARQPHSRRGLDVILQIWGVFGHIRVFCHFQGFFRDKVKRSTYAMLQKKQIQVQKHE